MKGIGSFNKFIAVIFVVTTLTVAYSSFVVINSVTSEFIRTQQASLSPFFSLITNQIIKPLNVAEVMASDHFLIKEMDKEQPDNQAMFAYLARMEKEFSVDPFIALEKSRNQLFSSGIDFPLEEGLVDWYFELKELPGDSFVRLGNTADPHIYIDIRITNESGEFLGFVGVGVALKNFVSLFEHYKKQFGYEFFFVDHDEHVILSSDINSMLQLHQGPLAKVTDLDWYKTLRSDYKLNGSISNQTMKYGDGEWLVSRILLDRLNWRLYVMMPVTASKQKMFGAFVDNLVVVLGVVAMLSACIWLVFQNYDKKISIHAFRDKLTRLPNRAFFESQFSQLPEGHQVSLILLDVDRFKQFNDVYGHLCGDKVLQVVGEFLNQQFRDKDIVARWGGEEFIVLLPEVKIKSALHIAERCREKLEEMETEYNHKIHKITASFGVVSGSTDQPLEKLFEKVDQALYLAKNNGRNRVEVAA